MTRGDLEQMVGNAVPVELARFVANRLQDYIRAGGIAMDERQAFSEWLRTQKGYTDRSISDVFSRLHRATAMLPNHEINQYFIPDLERSPDFQQLGVSIKSQIRKAINLKLAYLEYIAVNN